MNNLMQTIIYLFQPSPLDQANMLVDLHHSLLVSEVEVALLSMVQSVGSNPQPKVMILTLKMLNFQNGTLQLLWGSGGAKMLCNLQHWGTLLIWLIVR